MASGDTHQSVWGFIKGFGKLVIGLLLLIQGLIGLIVMLLFVSVLVSMASGVSGNKDKPSVKVPENAALLINPSGVLVEQAEEVDPFELMIEEAFGADEPDQVEVHQIIRALRNAKTDDKIKGVVLDFGKMQVSQSAASKLHYLADEIAAFKESGKKVIAVGDQFGQNQYLLAAQANEVYMNDYGSVIILGYGSYNLYLKSFLEKLKVTGHVFRVGTFKSAVEPFMRDDMSEEAKLANKAFLDVLWREYTQRVETARGLETGAVDRLANNLGVMLRESGGDMARLAKEYGLVDGLKSRAEMSEALVDAFGESQDGKSYNHVPYRRYLVATKKPADDADPNIALVTASGTIVDGEAPLGAAAGGDTIAGLLKKAREDDTVKAVVLRIDSPGGSAFASDIIRREVLALRAAGKPVVASMGSLAASGGYWIAAGADEIWAAPTTLTGSIGIFGFLPTFENMAGDLGIHVDGVGTTAYTPFMATGIAPLPDNAADVIQQSIEHGYERFLTVVGEGRKLDRDYVDSVAQGRVWIGERAQGLKLVDQLGGIDEAITAAARLAELEQYDVVEMGADLTPFEQFLSGLSADALAMTGLDKAFLNNRQAGVVGKAVAGANRQLEFFGEFNDPHAAYARCIACE